MPTLMVRYQVAEEGIADVTAAVEAAFAAVKAQKPKGIRYAYYRLAGSNEFVGVLELEGADNPLFGIEAARHLQSAVAKWAIGEPPKPQPLEALGSYGFAR